MHRFILDQLPSSPLALAPFLQVRSPLVRFTPFDLGFDWDVMANKHEPWFL